MKNALWIATLVIAGSASAVSQFPDGKFVGHGNWKNSNGKSGDYEVSTTIQSNVVDSKYKYGTEEKEWKFKAAFDENGFFPVISEGKNVGRGYCHSVQCHYEVTFGDTKLEETLTFVDGKMYRLGSKHEGDTLIAWEEALH